jgi:hypothetical protein
MFSLWVSLLQAPFSLTKTGPGRVTQGQPFNFEVTVVFLGTAKGVSILDAMPPGLWPTGNATWSGTLANNQAVPGGGECNMLFCCY